MEISLMEILVRNRRIDRINHLNSVIVIVDDADDTSRGRLSTAGGWRLLGDGSFPAEIRHR